VADNCHPQRTDTECGYVNGRYDDISKAAVNNACEIVLGYGSRAIQTDGVAVQKPNHLNGVHTHKIVREWGASDDFFYQILFPLGRVKEYRAYFCNGQVFGVSVMETLKTEDNLYGERLSHRLVDASAVYSDDELAGVIGVAEWVGVDFAEIDTIRDAAGRLHVIDINTTCGDAALQRMGHGERNRFLDFYCDMLLTLC
jgi:hypothetical protein